MSKFIIECPHCGKYAEGRTGFFARKKIDCACGYTINVRTDKLTGRECPHCGNMVVLTRPRATRPNAPSAVSRSTIWPRRTRRWSFPASSAA